MNKEQNNAIYRAAQRLERKPLPQEFEARVMARIERSQRREELQESALFASGIVATIALLVWAGMHYAPTLDFSFFDSMRESAPLNDFSVSPKIDWHWPKMSFIENISEYRILYIMVAITMGLLLADTYIRQRIRLRSQAKEK
ncbi:MAG: hypothetical protein IKV18_04735 [Alistipes sp.]|nr:hypothetical protein [Alistipes sp.]